MRIVRSRDTCDHLPSEFGNSRPDEEDVARIVKLETYVTCDDLSRRRIVGRKSAFANTSIPPRSAVSAMSARDLSRSRQRFTSSSKRGGVNGTAIEKSDRAALP